MKVEVIYEYLGNRIDIQCNKDEILEKSSQRFAYKLNLDINNLYFLYSSQLLDLKKTFENVANKEDKNRNKMNIIVNDKSATIINPNNVNNSNPWIIKSKNIICPICQENCLINIRNYKIILFECKNNHETRNIFLQDFNNTQLIDESNIKCSNCNDKNKYNSYKKLFYICLTCDKNLCPLCSQKHNQEHKIAEYNQKYFLCKIHKNSYMSFCKDCNINYCMDCYRKHKTHNNIEYKDILPDTDEINNEIIELRKKIDKLNKIINQMVEKLQKVKDEIEIFYQINYDILHNYKIENKNYQNIENVNGIVNNIKMNNIDEIINCDNDVKQFKNILNIYDKMFNKEKNQDIDIGQKEKSKMNKLNQKNLKNNFIIKTKNKEQKLNDSNRKYLYDTKIRNDFLNSFENSSKKEVENRYKIKNKENNIKNNIEEVKIEKKKLYSSDKNSSRTNNSSQKNSSFNNKEYNSHIISKINQKKSSESPSFYRNINVNVNEKNHFYNSINKPIYNKELQIINKNINPNNYSKTLESNFKSSINNIDNDEFGKNKTLYNNRLINYNTVKKKINHFSPKDNERERYIGKDIKIENVKKNIKFISKSNSKDMNSHKIKPLENLNNILYTKNNSYKNINKDYKNDNYNYNYTEIDSSNNQKRISSSSSPLKRFYNNKKEEIKINKLNNNYNLDLNKNIKKNNEFDNNNIFNDIKIRTNKDYFNKSNKKNLFKNFEKINSNETNEIKINISPINSFIKIGNENNYKINDNDNDIEHKYLYSKNNAKTIKSKEIKEKCDRYSNIKNNNKNNEFIHNNNITHTKLKNQYSNSQLRSNSCKKNIFPSYI